MNADDFNLYTASSYFTIRRLKKFWSGVWTDMIIEQILMRSMKTQGGLTHGRGMSESVISKFVLTMLTLVDISNEMDNFCDVSYSTSDQHVDSTECRIARDAADLDKLLEFFKQYNPFPETPKIMSIYSGIVGNESVCCHEAYKVGMKSVNSIIGKNFDNVKFETKKGFCLLKQLNHQLK